MNTLKRRVALQARGAYLPADAAQRRTQARSLQTAGADTTNPACVIGPGQRCEHPLVNAELNRQLFVYEQGVRARFASIVGTLKHISAMQHEDDFVASAQRIALDRLDYTLPEALLARAWVGGLDMRALHAHCQFNGARQCVELAPSEQASWRERLPLQPELIAACGFHTVDITPCADGRLQGVVPYVFRMVQSPNVWVKAYAGAMFDIEADMADWAQREVERLSGAFDNLAGASGELNYLKIAVYHFSSARVHEQGCAFHASNDKQAVESAQARLAELRLAIERTYGRGAAPAVLLIGVDTDLDSLRIHLPDGDGDVNAYRYVDTAELYRDTVGLTATQARELIAARVDDAQAMQGWGQGRGRMDAGMRRLVLALAEANLSQIEYVIHHHAGRYQTIGHDEEFICAGEAIPDVQLRNLFYFAHLDTLEEGVADMDVGIKILSGLNVRNGLAVPVLVHFCYSSRVPGNRDRAVARARRVRDAIIARYADLHQRGFIICQMAVSDRHGDERCAFIDDQPDDGGGH